MGGGFRAGRLRARTPLSLPPALWPPQDPPEPPQDPPPGPTMRVKLKNVFIIYFVVSLVGLLCALLQLGEGGPWGGLGAARGGP